MEVGYIKLYRSLLKWEWYDDINVKILFLHLLLTANFTDGKWHGTTIKPGQFVTSNPKLSAATGLTPQQLKTALSKLVKTGEITVEATNKFTLITIEKYEFFQFGIVDTNQQTTNDQQTINHQSNNKQQTTNQQATNDQQTTNKQATNDQQTTNNNIRREEGKEGKEGKEGEEGEEGEEGKKGIYQQIADLYNDTCVSLPRCIKLSQARKDALKARLNFYSVNDFKRMFEIAQKSDFLKGANARNWQANIDWMISDKNMPKILEGCYDNRKQENGNEAAYPSPSPKPKQNRFCNYTQREWDFEKLERLERERQNSQEETIGGSV